MMEEEAPNNPQSQPHQAKQKQISIKRVLFTYEQLLNTNPHVDYKYNPSLAKIINDILHYWIEPQDDMKLIHENERDYFVLLPSLLQGQRYNIVIEKKNLRIRSGNLEYKLMSYLDFTVRRKSDTLFVIK